MIIVKGKKIRLIIGLSISLAVALVLFVRLYVFRNAARTPHWIMRQYVDQSGNQAMFYTIRNQVTGEVIVIDGGWPENTENVRHVLDEYGNHVDAWILTHFHNDHACAFNEIYKDPKGIEIDTIYAPPLDQQKLHEVAREWDFPEVYDEYAELTAEADNIIYPERGSSTEIAGLQVQFFNTYDETMLAEGWPDIPNNCSLLFKVSGVEDSVLFCADCHGAEISDYMIKAFGDQLKAKYVQPGHHGNNSMTEAFYELVDPQIALFDAPAWLMEGENYTAKDLKAFFESKGVEVYDYTSGNHEFELH